MNDFKLDSNPKITSGFKIPESYFDNLAEKVTARLENEEPKVISFFDRNKRWLFSVAAILVIALSIPIVSELQSNEEQMTDTAEIENYLTRRSTLTEDDLVNLLEQEDIDKLKIDNNIDSETLEDLLINNNNLEQYITN